MALILYDSRSMRLTTAQAELIAAPSRTVLTTIPTLRVSPLASFVATRPSATTEKSAVSSLVMKIVASSGGLGNV